MPCGNEALQKVFVSPAGFCFIREAKMEGWIKWYRQSIDNKIWRSDRTAWQIFEYFLAIADYKTGRVNRAYSTISEFLGIPKSTLHKAIKRLKKAKMVNDLVNDKYTIFEIVNWQKYQNGERDGERKVNAKGTQSEHIQEVKNIRSKENTTSKEVLAKPIGELQDLINFSKEKNFPLQGTIKMNRYNASNLLKKFGLEKSKKLVLAAVNCRGKPYAPVINDFIQLYRKCGDLVNYYVKKKNERNKKTIIG